MVKKKLVQALGISLLSATFIASVSPAFLTTATATSKSTPAANASVDTDSSYESAEKEGWVKNEDGKWTYYENGEMVTGMIKPYPNRTYYFFADGTSAAGWTEIDGNMYYFRENESGEGYYMVSNEFLEGFFINADGIRESKDAENKSIKNGWIKSDDGNMYLYNNDALVTGWYKESSTLTSYLHENGAAAKGWTEIDGKMYYFARTPFGKGYYMTTCQFIDGSYVDKDGVRHDDDSFVQRGWIQGEDGNWRYYDYHGNMCTGLYPVDHNSTYYFDENGVSLSGWHVIDGKDYYFIANKYNKYGAPMITNQIIDGKYVNSSGWVDSSVKVEKKGWIYEKGNWYHYNKDGSPSKGFVTLGPGSICYFDKNGFSLSGWQVIDGREYYFENCGQGSYMVTNKVIDGKHINSSGYVEAPAAVKKGWVKDENGNWRLYDNNGSMYKGWYTRGPGGYCYFEEETGICVSGWKEINGKLYYFQPTNCGYIRAEDVTIDGIYIDKNGHAQKNN